MTTPIGPTGKLAYGQAGTYDAVDDRAVITAVTRGRIGLIAPVDVAAGAGLTVVIRGGWVGVASCGDLTSAVVGSREDIIVPVNPGPATGSRQDLVWCDTDTDAGTWEITTIPASQAAGRFGLPLVELTVPANANLASQMTIEPVDATLERRIISVYYQDFSGGGWNATGWATASDWATHPCILEPGQWYRVRATYSALQWVSGVSLSGRIGIGVRTTGQPATAAAAPLRTSAVSFAAVGRPVSAQVEYVFRHDKTAPRMNRTFSTRAWTYQPAQFYMGINETPHLLLTVEDIGS